MKKKTPFVVHEKDGVDIMLVKVRDCGIHYMVLMHDGVSLTFFRKGKTSRSQLDYKNPYIKLADALEWFKKESKDCPRNTDYPKAVEVITELLRKFDAGEIEENPERV